MGQPFAYVTSGSSNTVYGYTIDSVTGALTEIAGSPFPTGNEPITVVATPSGKFVYVTNYIDSTISAYSLNGRSGVLTPLGGPPFATGPNPFSIDISPSGKFLYTANDNYYGGGTPGVSAFQINGVTGALTPVNGSPFAAGTEPISLAFTPSGRYLYVSDPGTGTIFAFTVNSDGSLTQVTGSPYPAGSYPFNLAVTPSGKFLYVPNSDSGNISAYSINSTTGALAPISGSPFVTGGSPPSVAVTPSGEFLYVAGGSSNEVFAFRINRATGALTPVLGSPFPAGDYPYDITVSSSGQFVYATDVDGGQVSGYSINASTGALAPLEDSPFTVGSSPYSIAFANPAVKACGALNVSAEATLAPGPYTRQSRGSELWNETLTITNGVTPISGPLSVVLENLPSSTTTLSGTYPGLTTTYCFSAAGNYVVPIDSLIPPANDDTLLPGEALSVPFVFATTGGSGVEPTHYKPLLISGTLDK
jgi:6-phosphogluconolactonase